MSIVLFVLLSLLFVTAAGAVGLLVTMWVKDRPCYGALSISLVVGPLTVLAFTYIALSAT